MLSEIAKNSRVSVTQSQFYLLSFFDAKCSAALMVGSSFIPSKPIEPSLKF